MKEWREVTFMKEWVKPLYIGYHQALDLPQNLFPFPRMVQISLGPTQFLNIQYHSLLKLIPISTMAPNSSESCYAIYIVYKGKCQYQDKSETNNNSNVVKNHLVHISE